MHNQGYNHGFKVGGPPNVFCPRKGEEREGAKVQIGTPNIFFELSYNYLIVVTNKKCTGFRSDTNLLGNIRGTY